LRIAAPRWTFTVIPGIQFIGDLLFHPPAGPAAGLPRAGLAFEALTHLREITPPRAVDAFDRGHHGVEHVLIAEWLGRKSTAPCFIARTDMGYRHIQ
jgi:hypothetical protein